MIDEEGLPKGPAKEGRGLRAVARFWAKQETSSESGERKKDTVTTGGGRGGKERREGGLSSDERKKSVQRGSKNQEFFQDCPKRR